ncbi:hypothetical protein BAE44_0004006 [Dichanthelium oligosanthes]|uniref:Uncharacterized protein n=1 Tax=Dichanthelium oligosanthes TaxID=888268 RepID=A0A1E5WC52_9POAL|nr:hypothetical protein BAE44_0004006 [Dichanthelium oligosanthes]
MSGPKRRRGAGRTAAGIRFRSSNGKRDATLPAEPDSELDLPTWWRSLSHALASLVDCRQDGRRRSPTMAAEDEEPRADPELPQRPASPTQRTEERVHMLAHIISLAALLPSTPPRPNVAPVFLFALRVGEFPGAGGVGADDDAYRYGGFSAVPASGEAMATLPETTVGEGGEA